jgi:hypothetical protein
MHGTDDRSAPDAAWLLTVEVLTAEGQDLVEFREHGRF